MSLNFSRRFFQPGLLALCACGLVLGLSGCGKKAPLSLPDTQLTAYNSAAPANTPTKST